MKVLVIGAGLVGNVIAQDLSESSGFAVTAADISEGALGRLSSCSSLNTKRLQSGEPEEIGELSLAFDIVVNAVPGDFGYGTCKSLIEAGRKIVDIAFFPEDPRPLSELAVSNKSSVVLDCGVAPGLSNMMIGHSQTQLEKLDTVRILVGGLPKRRAYPFEYRAVFSPRDVIEEYLRPARMVENGEWVTKEALTECERIDLGPVGSLEAFNTDGLRSLLWTMKARSMVEKTVRYPGHCKKIQLLKDIGFFQSSPVHSGHQQSPLDITSELLIEKWKLLPGEEDLTVMLVEVSGEREGRRLHHRYELFDRYDLQKKQTSMSRTTGFTACAMVRAAADGLWGDFGLHFPEQLASLPNLYDFVQKDLEKRGVSYSFEETA